MLIISLGIYGSRGTVSNWGDNHDQKSITENIFVVKPYKATFWFLKKGGGKAAIKIKFLENEEREKKTTVIWTAKVARQFGLMRQSEHPVK